MKNNIVHRFLPFGAFIVIGLLPSFADANEDVGMPQFDLSTFPTQLTWLVISLVSLYIVMNKVALPRIADVLEARQNRIDGDLDRATAMKKEAEQALVAYEETVAANLSKAQELKRKIILEFSEQAAQSRLELSERLSEEARLAEQRIADEKNRSLEEISDVSVELVHAAIGKLAGMEIDEQEVKSAMTNSPSKKNND